MAETSIQPVKYNVSRYDLNRVPLATGVLTVWEKGSVITITYKDEFVAVSASAELHPYAALENLRLQLEDRYKSLLGIYGCRKDIQYRMVGNYSGYFCKRSTFTSRKVNLFEPTPKIKMLCTVAAHKKAYENWLQKKNTRYMMVC